MANCISLCLFTMGKIERSSLIITVSVEMGDNLCSFLSQIKCRTLTLSTEEASECVAERRGFWHTSFGPG